MRLEQQLGHRLKKWLNPAHKCYIQLLVSMKQKKSREIGTVTNVKTQHGTDKGQRSVGATVTEVPHGPLSSDPMYRACLSCLPRKKCLLVEAKVPSLKGHVTTFIFFLLY